MGHSKNSPKREIHSITCIFKEIRKTSNKQSKLTLKGPRERTTKKSQSMYNKENNKIRAEIHRV